MRFTRLASAVLLLMTTHSAPSITVADITRFLSRPPEVLTGYGIVVGLNGTGDGPADLPTVHKAARAMKSRLIQLALAAGFVAPILQAEVHLKQRISSH